MRKQFVKTTEDIFELDKSACLLLGDIGVFGFRNLFQKFPKRTYNIGILEQSTVSVAAGLSIAGMVPIVHTIAPFIVERALEQIKIDFGYQNLNGNFISVGSSYDYAALGSTHHCPGDVQQLLTIPNMDILLPGTSQEFHSLFKEVYNNGKPSYIRLSEYENEESFEVKYGKANLIRKGCEATIICVGNILSNVFEATKDMDLTILYYTSIKPFDADLLKENFNENIIVVEPYYEGALNYQISKVLEGKKCSITNIGVPHKFLTNYGKKEEHDSHIGLDVEGLKNKIEKCL